jgi:hypothetical protein
VAASGNAADGEEITNKFPKLESETGSARDVPDSGALQAFLYAKNKTIPVTPKPLVNHASQALVNHAGECRARYLRLTSLFKPIRTRLR